MSIVNHINNHFHDRFTNLEYLQHSQVKKQTTIHKHSLAFSMSARITYKPVEVQVVYEECKHVLKKTKVTPIQVPITSDEASTSKSQKRNSTSSQSSSKSSSSKSSRRNSWKSFLCTGAGQVELDSDSEAENELEFACQGIELIERTPGLCPDCKVKQERLIAKQLARDQEFIRVQVAKESLPLPVQQHEKPRKSVTSNLPVPVTGLKRMTIGTAEARQAATQAANKYGWKSKPDERNRMEPELVSQFVSMSGTQATSLPGSAVPRYENANIDIERWNNQIRTNHGTYPRNDSPAPSKPLPSLPLARRPRAPPLRLHERCEYRKEVPGPRRDSEVSEVSAMSNPIDVGNASPVSPITSRWPSIAERPKTREGEHRLRRQISNLAHEIDYALDSWQSQE